MRSKLSVLLIFALLFCAAAAFAQDKFDTSKLQVFGGYSLLHADTNGVSVDGSSVNSNFSGWNAEVKYNVNSWLGTVADFSGNYGTTFSVPSGSGFSAPSLSSYSFLFGPEVRHSMGRLRPFAHALFGTSRLSSDNATTDSAFAMALGGGVDYKLSKGFGLRLGQVDYLYTGHNALAYSDLYGADYAGLNDHQNNIRFSTGVVFGF